MTQTTARMLGVIAGVQSQIALLSDAQNQILELQKLLGNLQNQVTPKNEPDAAAIAFVASQISTAQTALQTASTALGVTLTPAAPLSPAQPISQPAIGATK
jgi:hypothetical protein